MNNDLKTTVFGLITTGSVLLASFGLNLSPEVVAAIQAVGFLIVSYFVGKKDKDETKE